MLFRSRGKTRSAHLIYPNGLPTVAALVPPDDPERVPVPLAMIPGTLDPLSVIAVLLRAVRETGRCEAAARGFDGRRVLVFAATTGGEEELPPTPRSRFAGRALRCDFTNEMLAGYRAGAGREADTAIRHGTLWLAPPAPGEEAVPVRGTMATRWVGDVMLYLTAAAP